MNISEFGQSIKQKYPQYANIDDATLGQKTLEKYPQYSDRVTVENPDATKGIFDAFKKGVSNIGESIKASGQELSETLATPTSSPMGEFAKTAKVATGLATGIAEPLIAEPISTLFRAGGEIVQNITGRDVNEATAQAVQSAVQPIADSSIVKNTMKGYQALKQESPEAGMAASSLGDIAELFTYAVGGKGANKVATTAKTTAGDVATGLVKGVEKAADDIGSVASPFVEKIGQVTGQAKVTTENATASVKKNLIDQIEGKTSSLRKIDKTRTDVIDTIAKNPNYHPDIDVDNRNFNTTNQVKNMEGDISNYSEQLGNLFGEVDQAYGGIDSKSIVKNIQQNIFNERNKAKLIVTGGKDSTFVKNTQELLSNMATAYGQKIPRKDLWEIRKQIDNSINSISDTNVQKSLRQDLRRAFASSLETSIPGDAKNMVKNSMNELSKLIEARDYSRDVLNGFKIQGGKLTDIIRNSVTSNIGQAVGAGMGGVMGNVPGAVAGFAVGKKIGTWLAENTLSSAAERKALMDFVNKTPQVFDDMKAYIDSLPTKEKDNAYKNIKKLPSPYNKFNVIEQKNLNYSQPDVTPIINQVVPIQKNGQLKALSQQTKNSNQSFERASNLTPEERKIEDAAFKKIEKDKDEILKKYKEQYGNVVNTDDFRQVFKKEGYIGSNPHTVHEPSSYLAKEAFAMNLKNKEPYATFYAGGPGSGKTSAIKGIPSISELKGKSAVVFDGTLANYSSTLKKIKQSIDAGKKVIIPYVYRDPTDSFVEGVVKRMLTNKSEGGRLVSSRAVADGHINSWETVKRLYEEGMPVRFIDNSLGFGKQRVVSFNELSKKIKYSSVEELTNKFNLEAKKLYDQGKRTNFKEGITKEQYQGFIK